MFRRDLFLVCSKSSLALPPIVFKGFDLLRVLAFKAEDSISFGFVSEFGGSLKLMAWVNVLGSISFFGRLALAILL